MAVTEVRHRTMIFIILVSVHIHSVNCLTNHLEHHLRNSISLDINNGIDCDFNTSIQPNNSLQRSSISQFISSKLGNFSKKFSLLKSSWIQRLSPESHLDLSILIESLILEEFENCSLMIAYETQYLDSLAFRTLLQMPNTKQVIVISNKTLETIQWTAPFCTGFFFLLMDENVLLQSMNIHKRMWNYQGRFIFIAPKIEMVTKVGLSKIGRDTEHIIGIVRSSKKSQWLIFKKKAFSSPPMKLMSAYKGVVPKTLFKSTIQNLNGRELKLVTFEWVPNVFYDRNETGHVVGYYGIDIQVVKTLAEFLNFTIAYMEPPPNEYFGGLQPNGSWTGLVGVISRNEADMAVDDLFCTLERNTVADFTASYHVDGMSFGARTALPLPSWQSLTFPFQLQSWIAFLVSLPISGFVMIMITKAVNTYSDHNYYSENLAALFLPFASLFRQPIRDRFIYKNLSIRTFLMALWLYCFIITIAYSSNLTAFLTVHRLPLPFETIRGIRESGRYVGGVGPFVEAAAQDDGNEDLKILAKRYRILDSMEELIKEVLKNKAVITVDRLFLEYALVTPIYDGQEDPKTSLRILKESFFTFPISVFLAKNSILKNEFDKIISRMVDAGLVRKWFEDALALSNKIFEFKQFISIQNVQDGMSFCAGYLFLLSHTSRCCLLNYVNAKKSYWNYLGRFIFVVPSIEVVNEVALSINGKKTEHVVAFVPQKNRERWLIYSKQFFITPPMKAALRESNSIFTDKLTNFNNALMKLVTIEWNPNTFYVRNEAGEVIDYYGIDVQVVKTLAEVLNFQIAFTETPSNEYFGEDLGNGTWTGLVGMISRNEVDMAVTDLFYTLERSSLVDFGEPFAVVSTCFMAKTTPPYPRWQSLLLPFKPDLWISLILLLIISAITTYFITYCNFRLNQSSTKPSVKFVLIPIRAHVRQSASISKCQTRSFRVFIICLWLYCIIITTAYSSKLTAFLTVERPPKSFETIKELKETGLNVGGLGPFYDAVSETEGNEDLKALESRFVVYNTLKKLLMDVLQGKAVMLVSRPFLEYISVSPVFEGQQNPKGQLRILKECFTSFASGMYLQKHSPFKRKFDDVIGKMLNGGFARKWFLDSIVRSNQETLKRQKMVKQVKNSSDTSEINTPTEGKVVSLTINHVQGIFLILLLGYITAFIVFLVEMKHVKKRKTHKF